MYFWKFKDLTNMFFDVIEYDRHSFLEILKSTLLGLFPGSLLLSPKTFRKELDLFKLTIY